MAFIVGLRHYFGKARKAKCTGYFFYWPALKMTKFLDPLEILTLFDEIDFVISQDQ